jgi:hypothetical protein
MPHLVKISAHQSSALQTLSSAQIRMTGMSSVYRSRKARFLHSAKRESGSV